MKYSPTRIEFAKIDDPKVVNAGDAFNSAFSNTGLMPLDQMFAVERNSPTAQDLIAGTWAKQCACFVHMCAFGYDGHYREPFLKFVTATTEHPANEALFKQCFNMNYKEILTAMRDYLDFTVYHAKVLQSKKGELLPEIPQIVLRDATQSEIGRIKGDAFRLAGLSDAAHLALITPYIRGERDPELLAAIGMDEFATGKFDRARKFLEAAATSTTRARAYLELSEVRMTAMTARGKLTPYGLNSVLTPLFTARKLGPPLPEVYETIAKAWDNSSAKPTAENLMVLDEGVNLFPRDSNLIYRDAVLKEQIGVNAAPLIRLGKLTAFDDATKDRFSRLEAAPSPGGSGTPTP